MPECKEADIGIGKDPVLSMDIRPSFKDPSAAALIVAGMAGNVPDLASLQDAEQGRGVIVKVSNLNDVGQSDPLKTCIRTRICTWKQQRQRLKSTNQPADKDVATTTEEHWYKANRVGVSVCRFDTTGEVVALGGWDYRLRLYRRSTGQPLALLRGHENSISAMDWAPGGSSLLVTGSTDGTVLVWDYPRHSAGGSLGTP
jgi:WD40 repeat protein